MGADDRAPRSIERDQGSRPRCADDDQHIGGLLGVGAGKPLKEAEAVLCAAARIQALPDDEREMDVPAGPLLENMSKLFLKRSSKPGEFSLHTDSD